MEAVRTGQGVHVCKQLKKEYKKQTRRARREAPEGSLPGQIAQT